MNMEIFKNNELLNVKHISITQFENKLFQLAEKFNEIEIDFSKIKNLKGDKDILEKAFLHQFIEEINT